MKEKIEQLIVEMGRKDRKGMKPVITFGLIFTIFTIIIFVKDVAYGFYFILGIILLLIWQRISDNYAIQHDKRADELGKELKKDEELCNRDDDE